MLNLTPHTIKICVGEVTHAVPPSGTVARVASAEAVIGECPITGATILRRVWGDVTDLPPVGTFCLVSSLVLDRVPGRAGVFAPDTGPTAIRDDRGQIIAVTRLIAA